ncbi:hypothetical protein [Paractinoplanes atraurantiacus]|uniref:DUF3040 domain-containing protein n=1 Tax=Paractinoplanes atraurantiacus TaxID=1036182 RepID=A0A285GQ17_9ACTN|nr:hypothetical protein [Actinoplanes atraurantiacus]SNY25538.1 hypothetical protein SAMN05421748_102359 [Actinoplanes atraurantiacus]
MEPPSRDPRFDAIVARLLAEDPSFGATTGAPFRWKSLAGVLLVIGAGLVWVALSVLMVVWQWSGVMVAVPSVVVGILVAALLNRRHRARPRSQAHEHPE